MKRVAAAGLNLALLTAVVLVMVFIIDGFIGRFVNYGDSPLDPDVLFFGRQTPNAYYTQSLEPFKFTARHNSDGFRERELPTEPLQEGTRILCLGDSFTYGWGVDDREVWVRAMERALNEDDSAEWEVLNLGTYGTNPWYARAVLKEFGPIMEPDIVLLALYQNNDALQYGEPEFRGLRRLRFWEKLKQGRPEHLFAFIENHWKRLRNTSEVSIPNGLTALVVSEEPEIQRNIARMDPEVLEMALDWRIPPYRLIRIARIPDELEFGITSTHDIVRRPYMSQILTDMQETAAQWGGEIRIALFPQGSTVDPRLWPEVARSGGIVRDALLHDRRFQDTVIHLAEEQGIRWIDLRPVYLETPERAYLEWDEHLNAYGNRVAGEVVAVWLRQGTKPNLGVHPAPFPEWNQRIQWDFERADGWTLYRDYELNIENSVAKVSTGEKAATKEPTILQNEDYVLDSTVVNRLRVRMRLSKGRYAQFWWGTEGKLSQQRVAVFPVVADGAYHVYDIALDHAVADYSGEWRGIRFDPALMFGDDVDTENQLVEVDWIALGHVVPTLAHPNLWEAVD